LRPSAMFRNDYCSQIFDLKRLDARNRRTSAPSHCALESCWRPPRFRFRAGKPDVTPCFERGSAQEKWRRPPIRHGWPRCCLGPMTTSASRTSARSQGAVRTASSLSTRGPWDYSSGSRWAIGSKRTRTRAGSNVTMLPFSRASTSWGRFATAFSPVRPVSGCPRREIG
jgi:hypothetical protein